jgi:hypothetical protein
MFRKLNVLLIALVCLTFVSCKRDDEFKSLIKDIDDLSTQIVQTVEQGKGSVASIDAAQKVIEARRDGIQKKMKELSSVANFQVSEETRKAMEASLTKNVTAVVGLQMTYMMQSIQNPAIKGKLEALTKNYQTLLMEGFKEK